jgi:hypothetical protein
MPAFSMTMIYIHLNPEDLLDRDETLDKYAKSAGQMAKSNDQ